MAHTQRRSPKPLHILVKFFEKEEDAHALYEDGLLYARRLKCFRREEEGPHRGDKREGSISLPTDEYEFRLEGDDGIMHRLELGPAAEVRFFKASVFDNLNIFCMSLFHASPRDHRSQREILDEVVRQINDSLVVCGTMGQHAVVVKDQTEFLARVRKAARRLGYDDRRGPVEYYDTYPSDAALHFFTSGRIQWYHAFLKSRRYEKQREYRFAFNTNTVGDDPLKLNVGRLDDITMLVDIHSLADRSNWKVTPR